MAGRQTGDAPVLHTVSAEFESLTGYQIQFEGTIMNFDAMPPVISTDTYNELLLVEQLAKNLYNSRKNFTDLCANLEKLYAHFDQKTKVV